MKIENQTNNSPRSLKYKPIYETELVEAYENGLNKSLTKFTNKHNKLNLGFKKSAIEEQQIKNCHKFTLQNSLSKIFKSANANRIDKRFENFSPLSTATVSIHTELSNFGGLK